MAKKMYIPVSKNHKTYKIYMDDVKKVHTHIHKTRPSVPAYGMQDGGIKYEALTDVEFEPLFLMWVRDYVSVFYTMAYDFFSFFFMRLLFLGFVIVSIFWWFHSRYLSILISQDTCLFGVIWGVRLLQGQIVRFLECIFFGESVLIFSIFLSNVKVKKDSIWDLERNGNDMDALYLSGVWIFKFYRLECMISIEY